MRGFESLEAAASRLITGQGIVSPGMAIAINAEKIIAVRRDPALRAVLLEATLLYPDGIGAVAALRCRGVRTVRVPGCELWRLLIRTAAAHGRGVFLLGGRKGTAERAAHCLKQLHPRLDVRGVMHGYYDQSAEARVIRQIVASRASLICVGMGSPKQEHLMHRAWHAYPDALFVGVGGSFDVLLGDVRRAPVITRVLGLEWLFRLFSQPWRWRRQLALLEYGIMLATGQLWLPYQTAKVVRTPREPWVSIGGCAEDLVT